MATVDSLHTLLVEELRDIYDAEKRLTKAIPKMAKAATNDDLRTALKEHLAETEQQVVRLEEAFEELEAPAKGKPCAGMKGIIEEGDEHVGEDFDDDGLRDATIIGAAQRVEHYEMAAYGTAIAHARLLDQSGVVKLLEQTLAEEKQADEKLTEIAESVVNLDAASQEDESSMPRTGPSSRRQAPTSLRSQAASSSRAGKRSRKSTSRSRR
ncbi:MAG TPA: ferritin-like domain-containing protein [Vicinamibacterales bacterium]|nr:ferritin-like domain-containing protein [Vicinamibacterales bacterium]